MGFKWREWKSENLYLIQCRKDKTENISMLLLWNQNPSHSVVWEEGSCNLKQLLLRTQHSFCAFLKFGLALVLCTGAPLRGGRAVGVFLENNLLSVILKESLCALQGLCKIWTNVLRVKTVRFAVRKYCLRKWKLLCSTHPETGICGIWLQWNSGFY